MSIKALQDYTYVSKYARFNEKARRRETWNEAVDRVQQMHVKKFPHVAEEINWAFDLVKQKRVLGSQRALQFGGNPIEQKNARMYNCIASYCDRLRFFQETFWLLLCGCGTGFSVQKHHIAKLPDFLPSRLGGNKGTKKKKFVIPDSIEGWSDALGILLATYFPSEEFAEWAGCEVAFDYSEIRLAGSVLASGVGKAPGPEPLRRSLEIIRKLLDDRCTTQTRLRPIDAYDIVMHTSDAVLSGGVRRSATLCMFSLDDLEMLKAKTGNWFNDNPQRARSNNSVVLVRSQVTKEQFAEIMDSVKEFGEPGFIFVDDLESLYNPCVEIALYAYDVQGNSGWQACVAQDTKLLTKDGCVSIGDSVDKEVEIWNGKSWKKVTPFQTGSNRKLFRVKMSDGSHLDCTDNHKWLVKDRFQKQYSEVETKDLLKFSKYQISTPMPRIKWEGKVAATGAYEMGFILGDGCCKRTDTTDGVRKPFVTLFGHDHDLDLNCRELGEDKTNKYSVKATHVAFDGLDDDFCHKLKYSAGLPTEIFTWDRNSCLEFIAGWMDADGTKAGRGFRIYGEKTKIDDLQLLLTKLGFYSSANLMAKSDERTNLGVRNQDVWYIQVSEVADIRSRRIEFDQQERQHSGKGMSQVIKSIEELPGLHDTFCVYEPELNQCVFNNVLTKQCNLCEINGKKIKSKEDFALAAKAAAIIGTLQASYTDFKYLGQVTKDIVEREALLGVSITGMMDNPDVIFDPDTQREMAQLILDTNAWMADKIGINPAARATCVKPAGCQRPDTMIVSDKGIFTLGELGREDGSTWQKHDISVLADDSYKESTQFFVNGQAKTKKITLLTGAELESTPNHKYKVLREGRLEWVSADQIVPGDLVPYIVGGYNNKNMMALKDLNDRHFNSSWSISPKFLNEDLCWLIGLYTGDGSNHAKGVRIHGNASEPADLAKASRILEKQFGLDSTVEPDRLGEGRLTLVVNSVDLLRWLELNGLKKAKIANISIPKTVRMSSPELVAAFVDGYWCAAGGLHPINKTRNWVSISKNMALQLVAVLRALGQDCSMREMPPTATSKGKKMRYWVQEKKGRRGNFNKSPLRNEYAKLDAANLTNYTPDLVARVEDSECMTLDIEVPDGHAYWANGYISHNTTSCILGSSSGIHPHHAKRYFRRIQGNHMEAPLQHFKKYNPSAVEKSVWSANKTDEVAIFCVEAAGRTKNDLSAIDLLKYVKSTQQNWVTSGKRDDKCAQPWLRHNVSNTINVRPNEWEGITDFIYDNREHFAGISLLPQSGDMDYPQAPFTTVFSPKEIVQMYGDGSLFASGLIVDGLRAFEGNLWAACEAVLGFGEPLNEDAVEKKEFIRRAVQFAGRYFDGNIKEMTYALKCVHNWKTWCDLTREYKDVDYTLMVEDTDETTPMSFSACGGGKCDVF